MNLPAVHSQNGDSNIVQRGRLALRSLEFRERAAKLQAARLEFESALSEAEHGDTARLDKLLRTYEQLIEEHPHVASTFASPAAFEETRSSHRQDHLAFADRHADNSTALPSSNVDADEGAMKPTNDLAPVVRQDPINVNDVTEQQHSDIDDSVEDSALDFDVPDLEAEAEFEDRPEVEANPTVNTNVAVEDTGSASPPVGEVRNSFWDKLIVGAKARAQEIPAYEAESNERELATAIVDTEVLNELEPVAVESDGEPIRSKLRHLFLALAGGHVQLGSAFGCSRSDVRLRDLDRIAIRTHGDRCFACRWR